MTKILKNIDLLSKFAGRAAMVFCVLIILVLTYEVIMRYAFNAPTIWAHQTSMILYGTIGMLGLSYVHLHNSHIRVDVFYDHLSRKGKAIIDVIFAVLFDIPLVAVLIYFSIFWLLRSGHEVMTESYWYPPAWPFRTVVLLGWSLFFLQIVANFIRDVSVLARGHPYD